LLTNQEEFKRYIASVFSSVQTNEHNVNPIFQQNLQQSVSSTTRRNFVHTWGGKMWHIPENFGFNSKAFLRQAWTFWWKGMPNFKLPDGRDAPVMPFRKMDAKMLPAGKIRHAYKNGWSPILKKMETNINIPTQLLGDSSMITSMHLDSTFEEAFHYIKQQYSYIFTNNKFNKHSDWVVSSWSKNTKASVVKQFGSEQDIRNLPPDTHLNKKRKRSNI
jgi:hypothetical protein